MKWILTFLVGTFALGNLSYGQAVQLTPNYKTNTLGNRLNGERLRAAEERVRNKLTQEAGTEIATQVRTGSANATDAAVRARKQRFAQKKKKEDLFIFDNLP